MTDTKQDKEQEQEQSQSQGPKYSGKTLGDVEVFVKPGSVIAGVLMMGKGAGEALAGSALVPFKPGHGDRITITFRLDERV